MRFLVFFRFKNGGQMVYGRNRFMQWSVKWKKRQIDQPLDHILFFHLTLHCINLFLPYTICPPFLKRKNTRNLMSYLCPIGDSKRKIFMSHVPPFIFQFCQPRNLKTDSTALSINLEQKHLVVLFCHIFSILRMGMLVTSSSAIVKSLSLENILPVNFVDWDSDFFPALSLGLFLSLIHIWRCRRRG